MSYEAKFHPAKTSAELAAEDPHIGQYEIAVASDTGEMKVGPGRWSELTAVGPVDESGKPKVYRALLTQSSNDAPVATVLENTLGGEVVWTRGNIGMYAGTLAGAFPTNKTFTYLQGYLAVGDLDGGTSVAATSVNRASDDVVSVQTVVGTFGAAWSSADDQLNGQSIAILVYP